MSPKPPPQSLLQPTINIGTPANGATLGQIFQVSGTYAPPSGSTVTGWLVDSNMNRFNPQPFTPMNGSWNCTFGTNAQPIPANSYQMTFQVKDSTGATASQTISITVK